MDGKDDLIPSPSDLQSFYGQQQRALGSGGGGQQHSPSSHLAGMHSVIRPMPNMSMSAAAILNSIGGGGSLAGMQFHMDPPLLHTATTNNSNMGSPSGTVSGPPVKRKRGRPRKYGPDGTMSASAQQQQHMVSAPPRMEMVGSSAMDDHQAQKKRRGRPPGTGKKHHLASPHSAGNAFSGTAGTSFTPHIITASPSEDVVAKIAAFANHSAKAVCVLSATGSVSRVVLRHPADASPMSRVHEYKSPAIYEGFYEILSLSGSYNLGDGSQPGQQQQSGGLSVTLCSPERSVIGGVLGGALVAASTVQVVLGSFHHGGSRSKSNKAAKQQQAFSADSLCTAGQEASPSSGHNQNLTPPAVTGGWPTSGIFDTTSNIDINSS